jgi:hypothetical protein
MKNIIESYLNGNLSETKQAIFDKPWLQSDIYAALPDSERDLFMQRCRAWHENRYSYKSLK